LHIDPQDDPVAGQPAYFFFEFKDTTQKFNLSDCACTFSALQAGKTLSSEPLVQNSAVFVFPRPDIYQVKVTGVDSSRPFSLTYDIRVSRQAPTALSAPSNWFGIHFAHLISAFVLAGLVGAMIIRERILTKPSI